jgi:hypothetical protein
MYFVLFCFIIIITYILTIGVGGNSTPHFPIPGGRYKFNKFSCNLPPYPFGQTVQYLFSLSSSVSYSTYFSCCHDILHFLFRRTRPINFACLPLRSSMICLCSFASINTSVLVFPAVHGILIIYLPHLISSTSPYSQCVSPSDY